MENYENVTANIENHATVTLTEKQMKQPLEIVFLPGDEWFMKITTEGFVFNREAYPNCEVDDFARAFMKLMEKTYKIKFIKNDS